MEWLIEGPLQNVSIRVYKEDFRSDPISNNLTILYMNTSFLQGYMDTIYGVPFYVELTARDANGASLSISSRRLIFVSCPRYACCGTEHPNSTVCRFNQLRGVKKDRIAAQRGAFRNEKYFDFQPCPIPACQGGDHKARGYNGTFCVIAPMICCQRVTVFKQSNDYCCLSSVLISTAACVYFIKATLSGDEKIRELEMIKIAFSGSQAMAVLFRFPLHWPKR